MDTPGKLSVHCVVMLVLSGLLIGCPTAAEAEEARICVNTDGFLLGSAISCTSGYLINVTGAEYWDLDVRKCGINVCPCDHVACRVDVVATVDGGSHYNSIIRHCQYKPQCQTVTLPRTLAFPCRGVDLLLIRYTCIDESPFPDPPTTPPRVITTEGSATPPTTRDNQVTPNLGTSQPTPAISDVDPTRSDVTTAVSPVSGAMVGLAVFCALMTVTVLVLAVCLVLSCRKTAAKQKELSAMKTTPTATKAALSSATNHVTLRASPYETLEIAPQAARPEGNGSATYSELTEAAAYINMAAGRSREQSGSDPGGTERSEAASYVNMAAGQRA